MQVGTGGTSQTPSSGRWQWQSPEQDNEARAKVKGHIFETLSKLLKTKMQDPKGNAGVDVNHLANRLENALYCSARSKAEYMDPSTLHQRTMRALYEMTERRNAQRRQFAHYQPGYNHYNQNQAQVHPGGSPFRSHHPTMAQPFQWQTGSQEQVPAYVPMQQRQQMHYPEQRNASAPANRNFAYGAMQDGQGSSKAEASREDARQWQYRAHHPMQSQGVPPWQQQHMMPQQRQQAMHQQAHSVSSEQQHYLRMAQQQQQQAFTHQKRMEHYIRFAMILRHAHQCQERNCAWSSQCKEAQSMLLHNRQCGGKCELQRCKMIQYFKAHYQNCGHCNVCGVFAGRVHPQSAMAHIHQQQQQQQPQPQPQPPVQQPPQPSQAPFQAQQQIPNGEARPPVYTPPEELQQFQWQQQQQQQQVEPFQNVHRHQGDAEASSAAEKKESMGALKSNLAKAADEGITSMGIGSSFFGPSVDPMHPNGVHEPPRKAIKQERNGETASLPFAKTDTASVTQGASGTTVQVEQKEDKEDVSQGKEAPFAEGTSLVETFQPEEIKRHLARLHQPEGEKGFDQDNRCEACGLLTLKFEPPPLYCFKCNTRIKRNQQYHVIKIAGQKHCWCQHCLSSIQGNYLDVEGMRLSKNELSRKRNQEDDEEPWVECDSCNKWFHQICVLFNSRSNVENDPAFHCPQCILSQLQSNKRLPTPMEERPRSQLPASSLPSNRFSEYLEEWLYKTLRSEQKDRAQAEGKRVEDVPTAEGLSIRVVSCINKTLETKQRFLQTFEPCGFPNAFNYRSKAILLFQKIDGVDVCLFAMYVQEYGADQPHPNHRRVYISYLDSVKYFEPEVKTPDGDALRTFVYHQIIIGYLKYCKERGFVTCNIWACPPPKGENYIFYCHPNKQRVPSNEKLRDWYYKLLRRSKDYEIVADHVNVYDHFCMGEIERMRSATDLPYFDGDYFTTAAEDALAEIDKGQEPSKIKSIRKSASSKRNLNVNSWLKGDKERDAALMYKMGETVQQVKADFLYVLLQHECSWCSRTIAGELRSYVPGSSFNLCSECAEHNDSLPPHEKHQQPLEREYVEPLPDTRDPDGDIENEFFETRLQFLQLCQGNHFQFDSLRRAKYSSMMVLYHLHNPSEPALAFTCNICRRTIEPGTGARCEVCHDFDLCEECFYKYEHEHKLQLRRTKDVQGAQSSQVDQERRRDRQKKIVDLIDHAFTCREKHCRVEFCSSVKSVFRHAKTCEVKSSGGCNTCNTHWSLLTAHVRQCTKSHCGLPRCRELKEYLRRRQVNEDQRRMSNYKNLLGGDR